MMLLGGGMIMNNLLVFGPLVVIPASTPTFPRLAIEVFCDSPGLDKMSISAISSALRLPAL